MTYGKV